MSEGDHLKVISNPGRVVPGEAPGSADDSESSSPPVEEREPDVVGRTLYLPRRLVEKLDQLAEFLEVEGSELVTSALRRYVEESSRNLTSALQDRPEPSRQAPEGPPAPQRRAPSTGEEVEGDTIPTEPVESSSPETARAPRGAPGEPSSRDDTTAPPARESADGESGVDADSRELLESCLELLQGVDGTPLDDPAVRQILEEVADRAHGRDYSPEEHPHEVARLSRLLAEESGIGEEDLHVVELGGLLHDVGKILVPVELLRKRGALTPREQHKIKSYPRFGAEILEQCPALSPLVPLVRHHKERWDGAGYPDGVAGEEIPRGARIIGLAEAYHAMLSPRPYRPALSPEAVGESIERRSGQVWCPETAEALTRVIERHGPHPWQVPEEAEEDDEAVEETEESEGG